jgi:hypothetical protein
LTVAAAATGGPTEPPAAPALPLLRRAALGYLPLLVLCYVVSIIDRVNVGFAKTRMQQALQFLIPWGPAAAGVAFVQTPLQFYLPASCSARWR